MVVFGPLSSVFDFITFFVLYFAFHLKGGAFQTGWFLESMATQTFVVYMIRTKKIPFIQSSPSKPLLFSTITVVTVAWLMAFLPINKFFNLQALDLVPILAIILIVVVYLITTELVKHWFYKKFATED